MAASTQVLDSVVGAVLEASETWHDELIRQRREWEAFTEDILGELADVTRELADLHERGAV